MRGRVGLQYDNGAAPCLWGYHTVHRESDVNRRSRSASIELDSTANCHSSSVPTDKRGVCGLKNGVHGCPSSGQLKLGACAL